MDRTTQKLSIIPTHTLGNTHQSHLAKKTVNKPNINCSNIQIRDKPK